MLLFIFSSVESSSSCLYLVSLDVASYFSSTPDEQWKSFLNPALFSFALQWCPGPCLTPKVRMQSSCFIWALLPPLIISAFLKECFQITSPFESCAKFRSIKSIGVTSLTSLTSCATYISLWWATQQFRIKVFTSFRAWLKICSYYF